MVQTARMASITACWWACWRATPTATARRASSSWTRPNPSSSIWMSAATHNPFGWTTGARHRTHPTSGTGQPAPLPPAMAVAAPGAVAATPATWPAVNSTCTRRCSIPASTAPTLPPWPEGASVWPRVPPAACPTTRPSRLPLLAPTPPCSTHQPCGAPRAAFRPMNSGYSTRPSFSGPTSTITRAPSPLRTPCA